MNNSKSVTKREIAKQQFRTAISLFLGPKNYPSVITLCGSSGNIFDQLVKRNNSESFVDYIKRFNHAISGKFEKRSTIQKTINTALGVVAHKHYWKDEADEVDLDLPELAYFSIIRVLADYRTIFNANDPLIDAFLKWSWANRNGEMLMENFADIPIELLPRS